jgi:hypothetical protein
MKLELTQFKSYQFTTHYTSGFAKGPRSETLPITCFCKILKLKTVFTILNGKRANQRKTFNSNYMWSAKPKL